MIAFTQGRGQWILALSGILLVMGGLIGVQVRTRVASQDLMGSRVTSALGEVLRSNQTQVQAQKDEIKNLRAQVANYQARAASGSGSGMTKLIAQDLEKARIGLGLVPVRGPGITLELADSTISLGKELGGDQNPLVLHDQDLVQVVNELWADGAEAISLNGQRLVAGSSIVCSGRLVQVNHEIIPAPFVFNVIGDAKTLASGLNMRGGTLDMLRAYQFKIKITQSPDIQVPAVALAPQFKYARPVLPSTQAAAPSSAEETTQ